MNNGTTKKIFSFEKMLQSNKQQYTLLNPDKYPWQQRLAWGTLAFFALALFVVGSIVTLGMLDIAIVIGGFSVTALVSSWLSAPIIGIVLSSLFASTAWAATTTAIAGFFGTLAAMTSKHKGYLQTFFNRKLGALKQIFSFQHDKFMPKESKYDIKFKKSGFLSKVLTFSNLIRNDHTRTLNNKNNNENGLMFKKRITDLNNNETYHNNQGLIADTLFRFGLNPVAWGNLLIREPLQMTVETLDLGLNWLNGKRSTYLEESHNAKNTSQLALTSAAMGALFTAKAIVITTGVVIGTVLDVAELIVGSVYQFLLKPSALGLAKLFGLGLTGIKKGMKKLQNRENVYQKFSDDEEETHITKEASDDEEDEQTKEETHSTEEASDDEEDEQTEQKAQHDTETEEEEDELPEKDYQTSSTDDTSEKADDDIVQLSGDKEKTCLNNITAVITKILPQLQHFTPGSKTAQQAPPNYWQTVVATFPASKTNSASTMLEAMLTAKDTERGKILTNYFAQHFKVEEDIDFTEPKAKIYTFITKYSELTNNNLPSVKNNSQTLFKPEKATGTEKKDDDDSVTLKEEMKMKI